jgi:RIP metalloprotease RseP
MGAVAAPAKLAGLKAGDVVTAVDGKTVANAKDFTSAIRSHAGKHVSLTVDRSGKPVTVDVVPEAVTRPDENGDLKKIGAIGVSVRSNYVNEHYGVVGTVKATGSAIGQLVTGTYDTFTKKLGTITKIYSKDRDPAGFVGVVGASRVSGEIAASPESWQDKLAGFTLLIAGLNLFVGIFNLLPLLPLDGGHIAVVWFEAVRDRIKRARGYMGEVIRVDYNKLMPITFAVVVLFAGFTLWILGADIVNPIKLNQ